MAALRSPSASALGPGGEFDLIRRFLAGLPPLPPRVLVGPGDDAAVVEGGWVLSTDLSVEDVHFRRGWITDEEIGFRAASAALSDLAAMAAEPVGVLASLALPGDGRVDAEAVERGIARAAAAVGAGVLGGDVSRSPGPLFLDLTVVGRADAPVLRSGAAPGDEVWVTGRLGGAAGAVRLWEQGREPPAGLRAAFASPNPRVEAARALARAGVLRALVDVSDGLAGDAGHLAAAGGVGVILEPARLPLDPELVGAFGEDGARDAALHGGEDYELCFAAAPGSVDAAAHSAAAGVPLTRVGRVEEGEGVWLLAADGTTTRAGRGGYDHLGGGTP